MKPYKYKPIQAISVVPLSDYKLSIAFDDGSVGIIDIREIIEFRNEFEDLKDIEYFKNFRLNADLCLIEWSNEESIDIELLYNELKLSQIIRVNSYHTVELTLTENGYIVTCVMNGHKYRLKELYSNKEDAINAGFSLLIERGEREAVEYFINLSNMTLLLVYSYLKSKEKESNPSPIRSDEYGRMFGPIGDYVILDYLAVLGYARNISEKGSRWSKVILTWKGIDIAKKLEKSWQKAVPLNLVLKTGNIDS